MADLPDRIDYTINPNMALCAAYRQLISDRVGSVSESIKSSSSRIAELEARIHDLEIKEAEQTGMTKSDAKIWGVLIVAVSAIVSTLIKLFLEGVIA